MLKKFYDDPYLYQTIKEVTNFTDEKKIEFIFDKLYGNTWTIAEIEHLMYQVK